MLSYLIAAFIVFPIIELVLLIKIGHIIGAFETAFLVIGTGVVGGLLARQQGLIALRDILEEINYGRMPADKLFDGLIILVSGIVLLTPGIITDVLGLLGLFPVTRHLFKLWVKKKVQEFVSKGQTIHINLPPR